MIFIPNPLSSIIFSLQPLYLTTYPVFPVGSDHLTGCFSFRAIILFYLTFRQAYLTNSFLNFHDFRLWFFFHASLYRTEHRSNKRDIGDVSNPWIRRENHRVRIREKSAANTYTLSTCLSIIIIIINIIIHSEISFSSHPFVRAAVSFAQSHRRFFSSVSATPPSTPARCCLLLARSSRVTSRWHWPGRSTMSP